RRSVIGHLERTAGRRNVLVFGIQSHGRNDGRVAVATRGGVFLGDGMAAPKTFTFVDGVPGTTANV
ncbi:MAG: hypothetical protein VYE67_09535, partial [Planctomycetota bacterium]|nr:hypothetical protein [Planctomycetota bacterium]